MLKVVMMRIVLLMRVVMRAVMTVVMRIVMRMVMRVVMGMGRPAKNSKPTGYLIRLPKTY